jgi:hypothetical protein
MANPIGGTFPTTPSDTSGGSFNADLDSQAEGAKRGLEEMRTELTEKASELSGEVKDAVLEKATDAKHGLSGGLLSLGGALRAAGDHLSESGQAGSSKLVGDAASGVEQFANSLDSKPLGQVIDELRTFGRNNAGGLFAGSMLAGLAFGRLLKTAETGATVAPTPEGAPMEPPQPSEVGGAAATDPLARTTSGDLT